jgi:hypothetical protein
MLPQLDEGAEQADEIDVIWINELLDKPAVEYQWLAHELLAADTSMLGAKPKTGKRVLAHFRLSG